MRPLVDRLSNELSAKYVRYIETLLVDLWSEAGFSSSAAGFTLRRNHQLRQFTFKLPTLAGETQAERDVLIAVIFEQIEELIDTAIADDRVAAN